MQKKLLFFITLICAASAYTQITCPTLNGPFDNDRDVPVDTAISWTEVIGAPGYLISVGLTPGGTEIINNVNTGSTTRYQPPLGLPENRIIYVTLTVFFFNSPNVACTSENFTTIEVTTPPTCTTDRTPANEETNVNVNSPISWNYTPSATGYRVTVGTTLGGNDLLNNFDVGNVLSYQLVNALPFDTLIFVQITPYNDNGPTTLICPQYSFTTGSMAIRPSCTELTNPRGESINVPLTPRLEWRDVPNSKGYRVTIGLSPDTSEVLDNLVFRTNSTLVIDFEPNRTFFITIIPFNDAGEALGCKQETFSTTLGCGPFLDPLTGELIDLSPEVSFPDQVAFCLNEIPYIVNATDIAEGYRWYKIDTNGNEDLISITSEAEISEEGLYRYEIYDTISQSGNLVECTKSKDFTVVSSEIATINDLSINNSNGNFQIVVQVTGNGNYEFSLNDIDGPYQNSNAFSGLVSGLYTVFVKDKNGCGIAQDNFVKDLTLEGFPNFFSPNGDGINDFWQFVPPLETGEINVGVIHIFDKYGNLLQQIDPLTQGWDGRIDGRPMPSSDYWFTAVSLLTQENIKGHFTLKR